MANFEHKAKGAVTNKALSDISAEFDNSASPVTLSLDVIETIEIAYPVMYLWVQPDKDVYFNWILRDEYDGSAALIDDSFESGVTGFTAGAGAAIVQSTDYARTGSNSMKVSGGTNTNAYSDGFTTVVGEKYRAYAYVYRESGNNSIALYKADNTLLITNQVIGSLLPASLIPRTWQMIAVDFEATATTTYIGPWGSTAGSGTYYVDDVYCSVLSNVVKTRDMWLPGGGGPIPMRVPWGVGPDTPSTLYLSLLRKVASTTNVKIIKG